MNEKERKRRKQQYDREYRAKNKERIAARKREEYQREREIRIERARRWRALNRPPCKPRPPKADRQTLLERKREYNRNNKDKIKEYRQKHRERILSYKRNQWHTNVKCRISAIKNWAKKKGRVMELTDQQIEAMITSICYYCKKKKEGKFIGIDRKDNNLGYTVENTVPCCWPCNRAKNDQPTDKFIGNCTDVAMNHSQRVEENQ